MRSVSAIKQPITQLLVTAFLLSGLASVAQENSPYSRYGWGNEVNSTPIATRGMGGISTGYVDYDKRYDFKQVYPRSQTINFLNPASYAKMRITSFDVGIQVANQTLRSQTSTDKYKASYANISYVQLGIPVSRKHNFGMVLGLRPMSRINYKVLEFGRALNPITGENIDSTITTYEGNGGSYQAYTGFGKAFGNLSIGANVGYFWGTKDFGTRKDFINDSVLYYTGNFQNRVNFGGLYLQGGIQYTAKLTKDVSLVLGASASLKQSYNAKADVIRRTIADDGNGGFNPIDSVYVEDDIKGKIDYPGSYSVGFTLQKNDKWLFGADYTATSWDDYRFYGSKDSVASTWRLRAGGQFVPNAFGTNYWGRITYRLGFNYGKDNIKYDGTQLDLYGLSAGFAFPVRPNRFSNQYTNINLAFEYMKRGNSSTLLRENFFVVSVGFTLSDLWFIKRKYD
ncbi:hypothetical protein KJS94_12115 [Flavihumibacter rivuli]|uniref:hypothetical protein n=1 Tax=Flavihumibacter rivuli TaxID=2838156 RepID=UPI001BDE0DB4|nr:hypothetical protein [Flavihumibacter rivuli]ULQ55387.1 hypothetical protein KJS94_12115 [Flavihumibacter rivuli]